MIPPPPSEDDLLAQFPEIKRAQLETPLSLDFLHKLDRHMGDSFDVIIRRAGHPSEEEWITTMIQVLHPIVLNLKNHFNQYRPWELAQKYGFPFEFTPVESALANQSYPSGHTTQAHYIAGRLSSKFPHLADLFRERAREIEHSRLALGVHFPTDNEAGRLLAAHLLSQHR